MRIKVTILSMVIFFMIVLIVGCSLKSNQNDEGIQTIETVLEKSLTGPREDLKEIMNDVDVEGEEKSLAWREYEENTIGKDNFVDNEAYNEYVSSYGVVIMIDPLRNDYVLNVKNIEFQETEPDGNIYDFVIELEYQKEDSESVRVDTVKGQANLNDDNKLKRMSIRIDDFIKDNIIE